MVLEIWSHTVGISVCHEQLGPMLGAEDTGTHKADAVPDLRELVRGGAGIHVHKVCCPADSVPSAPPTSLFVVLATHSPLRPKTVKLKIPGINVKLCARSEQHDKISHRPAAPPHPRT